MIPTSVKKGKGKVMIISVVNKKGGVGKTPIAYAFAKEFDTLLASNEPANVQQFYPKERLKIAPANELPIVTSTDIVYDFGGFVEIGITRIIAKSDLVVIPVFADGDAIRKTIETAKELQIHNNNIVFIATQLEGNDFRDIKLILEGYFDYKIYPLRKSKIFNNLVWTGKSLSELYKENKASKRAFESVYKEWKEIKKYIKGLENGKN